MKSVAPSFSTLGEFITLQRGFDLPSQNRKIGNVPVVASNGINGYHSEPKVRGPGVVIGRSGSIGGGQYIAIDFWPLNTTLWVSDFKGHHERFVYYLLRSIDFSQFNAGAGVPTLNRNHIAQLKVRAFSLEHEIQIANTLAYYDDLIANNERRIALLERSARLLFEEWFVHFRYPGHELDKIVNGAPERWTVRTVADFFDTASGGTPSRTRPEFFGGTIPWVKTQELYDHFVIDTSEKITPEALSASSAKLFPAKTVLVAMYGATIGETSVLAIDAATNQACCALMPKSSPGVWAFAYLFFKTYQDKLVGLSQGAAQNNVSQSVIRQFPMTMPDDETMSSFLANVVPVLEMIRVLQAKNKKLADARNLLLPRLMDGRIAV